MKALVLERYGQSLRAVDMPAPEPGPRQMPVRMVASGVNHADEHIRVGEFKAVFRSDLPKVMGGELSGEVAVVGDQVTEFAVEDQVYGYIGVVDMGAWAEIVAVDADALAPAPHGIPSTRAVALPVVALTVRQALVTIGRLQPGQTVLVHGGVGGVGSAVIQLAKHLGATVAITISAASAKTVKELGTDIIIDYRNSDFVEKLTNIPVDIVVDTQGGEVGFRSFEVLRRDGILIDIAGTPDPALANQAGAGSLAKLAPSTLSLRLRRRVRKLGTRYRFLFIEPDGEALRIIARLVGDGVIKPVADRILPFDDTSEAPGQLLAGGVRGKVLVTTIPEEAMTRA